jgi:SEC-C motif-containing protein
MTNECPCGSTLEYDECCGAIIHGKREAKTAEELMRSRYTAFVKVNVEYLMRTQYKAGRSSKDKNKIKRWAQSVQWLDLAIKSVVGGTENDETGVVTFRAFYIEKGEYENLYEESQFQKIDGKWMYINGIDLNMENEEKLFSER